MCSPTIIGMNHGNHSARSRLAWHDERILDIKPWCQKITSSLNVFSHYNMVKRKHNIQGVLTVDSHKQGFNHDNCRARWRLASCILLAVNSIQTNVNTFWTLSMKCNTFSMTFDHSPVAQPGATCAARRTAHRICLWTSFCVGHHAKMWVPLVYIE